jgi:hypothetical protein
MEKPSWMRSALGLEPHSGQRRETPYDYEDELGWPDSRASAALERVRRQLIRRVALGPTGSGEVALAEVTRAIRFRKP